MSFLDSFRAAPQGRQIVIAATAAAALCALLFAVYFFVLHKPYGVLFTDLKPMDAATIVAELDKRKVPYRLSDGGATILAPEDIIDSTRLSIMGADLPIKGMVGFELFNKSDMGLTEFAQKINYQRALQGELSRTIMTMDGIDTARVHLSITEPTIFRDDRTPPKASVTILTRPGKPLSVGAVRGIQRLVAAAVPELDIANVVILDDHGEVLSGAYAMPEEPTTPAMQERRAVEEYYAARIRMALLQAYPHQAMEVSVAAPFMPSEPAGAPDLLNPAVRAFALRVAVSPQGTLEPQQEADVLRVAGAAVGLDPALGDVITISAPVEAPAIAAPLPQAGPAWTAQAEKKPPSNPLSLFNWGLVLVLPLLLLLFWIAFALSRRGSLRTLTPQQRGDYTHRLKTLLERGDADAAPPL